MKILLVILMILCSANVTAQDVIVKKDGSTILSKVIEIGSVEVKYKKFSNLDGPTYSIIKSEIQAINYENGEKEIINDVLSPKSQPQQQEFNYNRDVARGIADGNRLQKEKLYASAKSWNTVGGVWSGLCIVGGLSLVIFTKVDWPVGAGVAGAGIVGGAICYAVANNKEKAANSIASVPIIKHNFNIGNSHVSARINLMNDKQTKEHTLGLGLAYNF